MSLSKNRVTALLGVAACVVGSVFAFQPAAPQGVLVSLEGPLQAVDAVAGTITVMGITVDARIASISTPTNLITLEQLAGPPLQGRQTSGFINGTAIVNGFANGLTVVANDVFAEPAENVIAGPVTRNDPGGPFLGRFIEVLGVPVVPIDDPRFTVSAVTATGLPLAVDQLALNSLATLEGFFGLDGQFHAFALEGEGAPIAFTPLTSVFRAQCDRGRLQVRGGSNTAPETISLINPATGALLGTGTAVLDPVTGEGEFRISVNIGTCVSNVRIVNSNGSEITSSVVVR